MKFLTFFYTADGDCSHEIKRRLLLGRKVMTNLDSIFKSREITLPTKVRLVKAMFFPVVTYGCESWIVKKAERWRIDTFELWCWRRSVLGVHWKDWCWNWNYNTLATWWEELAHWKRSWCWERLKAGGEGGDKQWDGWMAYLFKGHELEQTLEDSEGQESLTCCSPWSCKELDTTEQLNWNECP